MCGKGTERGGGWIGGGEGSWGWQQRGGEGGASATGGERLQFRRQNRKGLHKTVTDLGQVSQKARGVLPQEPPPLLLHDLLAEFLHFHLLRPLQGFTLALGGKLRPPLLQQVLHRPLVLLLLHAPLLGVHLLDAVVLRELGKHLSRKRKARL